MSSSEDNFLKEALKAGPKGVTAVVPTPEGNQKMNDILRREWQRGTIERDANTGELLARDGVPISRDKEEGGGG